MKKTTAKPKKITQKIKTTKKTKEVKKEKKPEKVEKEKKIKKEFTRFFEAVGRRKTSVARVRLFTQGEKEIIINEKPFETYFPIPEFQQIVVDPLKRMKCKEQFRVSIIVRGGGGHSQAEAIRLGVARALILFNPDFRKKLKKVGFLTRDGRIRERKKFGLKRARRAPQWQKR